MCIVTAVGRLARAATVFFGSHGAVTRQARQHDVSRQSLYREADAVLRDLEGSAARQQLADLRQEVERLHRRVRELEDQLAQAVVLDADRQARFAATAQAEGVSLPVTRRLLQLLLGPRTPAVATLGRMTAAAARRATAVLAVLDPVSRPRAEQVAADEIFFGRRPCLMVVEQHSLCWLSGRLAPRRDGLEWAQELQPFTGLQQLTRDAGYALAKGVALVNAQRRQHGQARIDDQEDHFHALREGSRPRRHVQRRAEQFLAQAEAAQQYFEERRRKGQHCQAASTVATYAWRRAEAAFEAWSATERAWAQVEAALQLFTPTGALATRAQAEAMLAAGLAPLTGPEWSKAKRLLQRPAVWTFLDRVHRELAALPVAAALREAAVRVEGLRRRPEALAGEGRAAGARRGLLLAARVVLHQAGAAGAEAQAQVRRVLQGVWRASSLVECINSVARMQQARHRKITQGLLDLKRLYWNCREFRTGRRRRQTPYGLLGVQLPTADWWELLQRSAWFKSR
jgi:hypothetical protein